MWSGCGLLVKEAPKDYNILFFLMSKIKKYGQD
jgi:hypothetical protein